MSNEKLSDGEMLDAIILKCKKLMASGKIRLAYIGKPYEQQDYLRGCIQGQIELAESIIFSIGIKDLKSKTTEWDVADSQGNVMYTYFLESDAREFAVTHSDYTVSPRTVVC